MNQVQVDTIAADSSIVTVGEPATSAIPLSSDRSRSAKRTRSVWSTLAVGCVLIGTAIVNRDTVHDAARKLGMLSFASLTLVIAAVAVHRFLQASLLSATIKDLSLTRSLIANEAYVACTNATVGGGAIGTGVKITMLRQWGVAPEAIATSVTATSVFPAISLWFVAMLGGLWIWASGMANQLHLLVIGVGFALSVGPVVFWSVLLRSPRFVGFIARPAEQALRRFRSTRLVKRLTPTRAAVALDELNLVEQAERLRVAATPMLGRQGLVALLCALGNQATLSLVLIASLNGLGAMHGLDRFASDGLVGQGLAPLAVIAMFSVARTLATFAPIPGGLGVVDAGVLSGLVALGIDKPTAIAAIGLFRAVTFVLPLITGPLTILIWRRTIRRRERQTLVPATLTPVTVHLAELVDRGPSTEESPLVSTLLMVTTSAVSDAA